MSRYLKSAPDLPLPPSFIVHCCEIERSPISNCQTSSSLNITTKILFFLSWGEEYEFIENNLKYFWNYFTSSSIILFKAFNVNENLESFITHPLNSLFLLVSFVCRFRPCRVWKKIIINDPSHKQRQFHFVYFGFRLISQNWIVKPKSQVQVPMQVQMQITNVSPEASQCKSRGVPSPKSGTCVDFKMQWATIPPPKMTFRMTFRWAIRGGPFLWDLLF